MKKGKLESVLPTSEMDGTRMNVDRESDRARESERGKKRGDIKQGEQEQQQAAINSQIRQLRCH